MFFREVFFALFFFLPVGIANCSPIIAAKIPLFKKWSYPIDCYQTFQGKRIFGDHKTIRGLIAGIFAAIITVSIQKYLYQNVSFFQSLITLDYKTIDPISFGTLSAIGALGGDMFKSFFKRQFGIASGKKWFPFDQLDYIVGGILTTMLVMRLTFFGYILICILWFILHIVVSRIGYMLRLKSVPF